MGIDIWRMELTLLRTMRGEDKKQSSMLVLMSPESRVPQSHPLRAIKKLGARALDERRATTSGDLPSRPRVNRAAA
jgi:hypothetical protein